MEASDADSSHETAPKKGKRLRRRHLNEQQQVALEREYQINPRFDSDRVVALAKQLGLNRTKVYKWGWDRRKKEHTQVPDGALSMFQTERITNAQEDTKKSE